MVSVHSSKTQIKTDGLFYKSLCFFNIIVYVLFVSYWSLLIYSLNFLSLNLNGEEWEIYMEAKRKKLFKDLYF